MQWEGEGGIQNADESTVKVHERECVTVTRGAIESSSWVPCLSVLFPNFKLPLRSEENLILRRRQRRHGGKQHIDQVPQPPPQPPPSSSSSSRRRLPHLPNCTENGGFGANKLLQRPRNLREELEEAADRAMASETRGLDETERQDAARER